MTDPKADPKTLIMYIEHLLLVIDDRIPEGTDGCQICENARHLATEYRKEKT